MDETADLLTRARAGERAAFDLLFARTLPRLEWFVELRLGGRLRQRVEVADLVQETYAAALSSLEGFEPRGAGSFLRWLLAVAGNQVRRAASHHGAARRAGGGGPADDALALAADPRTGPRTSAERQDLRAHLLGSLEGLESAEREALSLRVLEGRPLAEVAERMERSESAVRRLVAKALVSLGHALGPEVRRG